MQIGIKPLPQVGGYGDPLGRVCSADNLLNEPEYYQMDCLTLI